MLSFTKEAVTGVTPTASLLSSTISAAPPPRQSPLLGPRGGRSESSASSALCGVTSQRQVFTVAQVLTAVLAEAHPAAAAAAAAAGGGGGGSTDPAALRAAAALLDSGAFDLRVAEDDHDPASFTVDPDFPPIDAR
jgi:hypothetical protein